MKLKEKLPRLQIKKGSSLFINLINIFQIPLNAGCSVDTWGRGALQWQGLKEVCFLSDEVSGPDEALGACRPTLSDRVNVISLGQWNGRAGTTFLVKCSLLSSENTENQF